MLKRAEIETATATAALRTAQGKGARGGMITAREIEAGTSRAKAGERDVWLTDPGARGQGRFTIRCTPAGARVCMYRYNGLKCAAGHLLTDEEYNTYPIEGQIVYNHLDEDDAALASRAMPTKLMLAKGHNLLLVKCLQRIHDQSEPSEWESQWKDLARVLGLYYNHEPVYAYEE